MEEFFKQGDKEQEQGLDFSPLCDRQNTMVPQSQIGEQRWNIWCLSQRWLDGWLKLKYSQRSNNYDQNVCSMTLYCFFFDWYCHKLLVWGKYSSVHYNITRLESPFTFLCNRFSISIVIPFTRLSEAFEYHLGLIKLIVSATISNKQTIKTNKQNTMYPGFIDFIVSPTLAVCGDMVAAVLGEEAEVRKIPFFFDTFWIKLV